MFGKYPIADAAWLFSDPARVAMLTSLLGGESRPAGEFARLAGLSPQAATAHLAKLVDGEVLSVRTVGRHRYFRIAEPEVIHALEALAVMNPRPKRAEPDSHAHRALKFARTCYDHLAGQLAVQIWDALENSGLLVIESNLPELSRRGENLVSEFGIDLGLLRRKKRPLIRSCMDWTERRHHMAGALGCAMLGSLLERGWLIRQPDC